MSNVDELIEEEINALKQEEEIFDLESLITDGDNARIPIIITFPNPKGEGAYKARAMIRPLTNIEVMNASKLSMNASMGTTFELEILKQGLYTMKGEIFPDDLIEKIPSGVVSEIAKKILKVSGIEVDDKENMKLAKELMGF